MKIVKYLVFMLCISKVLNFTLISTPLSNNDGLNLMQTCLNEFLDLYVTRTTTVSYTNFDEKRQQQNLYINKHFPVTLYDLAWYKMRIQSDPESYTKKIDVYVFDFPQGFDWQKLDILVASGDLNHRAKFFIILERADILKFFEFCQKQHLYDVVTLSLLEDEREVVVNTYFPFENGKLEDKLKILYKCDKSKCFDRNDVIDLFPRKFPKNWNNLPVKVGMYEFPPYAFRSICHQKSCFRGIEADILKLVAQHLGFQIFSENIYKKYGSYEGNGSFSPPFGDIQKSMLDVMVGGIGRRDVRLIKFFDFTYPYLYDTMNWVVPVSSVQSKWMLLTRIFPWSVWTIVVITLICVTLVFKIISRRSTLDTFLDCLSYPLGQAASYIPRNRSGKLALLVWLLGSLLIATAFQSTLIDVLGFMPYERQIDSVEDIAASNLGVAVFYPNNIAVPNVVDKKYLKTFVERMKIVSNGTKVLELVAFDKNVTTLQVKAKVLYEIDHNYLDENGDSLLYIIDKSSVSMIVQMCFSKGSPVLDDVDRVLQLLRSNGIIEMLQEKYAKSLKVRGQKQTGATPLTLEELQGIFWILLIGWIISMLAFIVEMGAFKYLYRFFKC